MNLASEVPQTPRFGSGLAGIIRLCSSPNVFSPRVLVPHPGRLLSVWCSVTSLQEGPAHRWAPEPTLWLSCCREKEVFVWNKPLWISTDPCTVGRGNLPAAPCWASTLLRLERETAAQLSFCLEAASLCFIARLGGKNKRETHFKVRRVEFFTDRQTCFWTNTWSTRWVLKRRHVTEN